MKLKKQRRCLSLIEVIIGFALTAVLLSFLFSGFRHMATLSLHVQKARDIVHTRALLQLRLSQLLDRMHPPEKGNIFYTDNTAESLYEVLFFTFDNGLDPDRDFCSLLTATLYLNTKKELCLKLQTTKGAKERTEVLMEKVNSLSYQFFNQNTNTWESSWNQKEPPSLFKLWVNRDELLFAFLIPEVS